MDDVLTDEFGRAAGGRVTDGEFRICCWLEVKTEADADRGLVCWFSGKVECGDETASRVRS